MRKILYYNKSFCYKRKMIILQQNILLQYRKILYHNKAFCCNRKKKKNHIFQIARTISPFPLIYSSLCSLSSTMRFLLFSLTKVLVFTPPPLIAAANPTVTLSLSFHFFFSTTLTFQRDSLRLPRLL